MLRDRLSRPLTGVRRAVLARRRVLAALLAAVAVASGVQAATAPPPPAVTVLAAARALPAGAVIERDDLVPVEFAPASVPADLVDEPVGRTLAAPLSAGETVTAVRLLGPALTGSDPTRTALPVRLPDAAMADLLEVGDRIDLIATDPQAPGSDVVAPDVVVLAVPRAPVTAAGQPGALVVVGADPADVARVSEAGVRLFLTYAFAR